MNSLKLKKPCLKCENNTLNRCSTCGRFLCNRCKSKKTITIPISNNIIPKGICQDCKKELLTKGTLLAGHVFQELLKSLINKYS